MMRQGIITAQLYSYEIVGNAVCLQLSADSFHYAASLRET
jgi:hypothetical protein